METNRIKISSIVESQLPLYVREEYPLVSELLTEYYRSLESIGSSYDILQNIDKYLKVNNLTNLSNTTTIVFDVDFFDTTIFVESTVGFPERYGIININDEIILYKSKTDTSFNDCIRGFSGVFEYSDTNSEDLSFASTEIQDHSTLETVDNSPTVINLGAILLNQFFEKIKKQFLPGFDDKNLYPFVNKNIFLTQSRDFYSSKGTDRSFQILFKVLFGEDVEIIKPQNYLIQPSNSEYRVTRNIVVEPILGSVESLKGKTIFQDLNSNQNIPTSAAAVVDVQGFISDGRQYYTLMLDYDFDRDIIVKGTLFGSFSIHPKTVILDNVEVNSDIITVDSTVGFSTSGTLYDDQNGFVIEYTSKTTNQFLNCSSINGPISSGTNISALDFAYGFDDSDNEIRFRITGVIDDAKIPSQSRYYDREDIVEQLSLGYNKNYIKDNNWIFNKSVKCEVKDFISVGKYKYSIETYDDNGIYGGESVEIDYINLSTGLRQISVIDGSSVKIPVNSVPGKIFQIETDGFEISNIFYIKKIISKFSNKFTSDVTNIYRDFDSIDDKIYITSPSLPFYGSGAGETLNSFTINLTGSFSGSTLKIVDDGQKHGFLTGDAVFYSGNNILGIQTGLYYVNKLSDTEINLASSRANINFGKYISIGSTTPISGTLSLARFSKKDNQPSEIDSQRLIKLLKNPENIKKQSYTTQSGPIGILVNGVEILNYKSDDKLYYGKINSVSIISSGNGYDIINPPELEILPSFSGLSSARGYCGIEGSLKRIDIIDSGFNYVDNPIVKITGGGGKDAHAFVNTVKYDHFVYFNPTVTNPRLNLVTNTIGFSTYHKFANGESVIYVTGGKPVIGGLTTEAKYSVKVIDEYRIKLHKDLNDSLAGINTIDITSYGSGNHQFRSASKKTKISSIEVVNQGSGYKSKKISIPSSGINTSNNTINANYIPYNNGDIIYYYGGTENIVGLNTGRYIVTKIEEDSFKLSNVGVGTTSEYFYYSTNQYVDFKSKGSGYHIFDYDPIVVNIIGNIGIGTSTQIDLETKIQPIFRGKIISIFIEDGGVGYGSSEIINYNKQPEYSIKSGYGAQLTPVVSDGKLVNVVINQKGYEYNSPPILIVRGSGVGAKLTPIINNGKIVDVKIISQGIGYKQNDITIEVLPAGSGCRLLFNPQTWTINQFERLLKTSKLSSNEGVVFAGRNKDYGIQYTHLYAPIELRKRTSTKKIQEGIIKYRSDYLNDFSVEYYHSPLLGWAYDGNPIYGPYGYESTSSKKVKQIKSGYSEPIDNQKNRPSKKVFPAGYFVEDYEFTNSGDLDEYNGRFCITPEFPNGIYAYFATLDTKTEESGFFIKNKKPIFPYIIGNKYKSKPIDFNFDSNINQDNFDLLNSNLVRNTNPYNSLGNHSFYEGFKSPSKLTSKVNNIHKGVVNGIQIISGGQNYKVGDRIIFDNTGSGGQSASAKVALIKGKKISNISQNLTTISDVEFYPLFSQNNVIGFSSSPHNLENADFVTINSVTNFDRSLNDSFNIGVSSEKFILTSGIGSTSNTGIITYFNISGALDYPYIRENDILTIENEQLRVLNVDKSNSRIRVIRTQNSTVGTSHSAYSELYQNQRKVFINLKNNIKNQNYKLNKELYFDPNESLGIGTIVGVGHTIVFSNPGSGLTSITIPQKTIYLPDHDLETGDKLLYKTNTGIGISVKQGSENTFTLSNNSIVYAAKITKDLIGISTVKVGLGTTGEFVGISQTASTLSFVSPGSGNYHSFSTKFDNTPKVNIIKNKITVSTASTHSLKKDDKVLLNVLSGLTTTITFKYDDYHRKLIVNPRNFSSVDLEQNLITIPNHNYVNGQKVIHTSTSPAGELEDEGIYYVVVYDTNRIKLSKSYYDAVVTNNVVTISSSSFGTISSVNPEINLEIGQKILIDLSDTSLSEKLGIGRTSSFDFGLFLDKNLESRYLPVDSEGISKLTENGNIGISSSSNIEFTVDEEFLTTFWYGLIPKTNLSVKNEYLVDDEIANYNKITILNNELNGTKKIVGITSNTFSFHSNLDFYTHSYKSSEYYTDSQNETGEIASLIITSPGINYERLPSISSITSSTGSGAVLIPFSDSIGKVKSLQFTDIGRDYSLDPTIRPAFKFSTILRIEPLSTIESIKVVSPGSVYNTKPDLLLIDSVTKKVINDVLLDYNIDNQTVNIIQNVKGIYAAEPRVVSVNNTNGVGINSIQYSSITENVRVYLNKEFSNPETFPFLIGDNVFVEGVGIVTSTDKGYDSKNYNYSLFPVVGVQTSLGGSGAYIEYSLKDYVTNPDTPGLFNPLTSSGRIIAEKSLPKFKTSITKNTYIIGESISIVDSNSEEVGKVVKFDQKNEFLTLSTKKDLSADLLIIGQTSKSQALIREIYRNESFYYINSSSIVPKGSNKQTGFLNNDLQRIQDSFYYQYFSYSLKSGVEIDKWASVVDDLNHIAGFKKFGDLIVNSIPEISGIQTSQDTTEFSAICELNSIVDVDCIQDYDLVSENNFYVNNNILTSDEIKLNSSIILDYSESIGNQALSIDDISDQFTSIVSNVFVTSFNI